MDHQSLQRPEDMSQYIQRPKRLSHHQLSEDDADEDEGSATAEDEASGDGAWTRALVTEASTRVTVAGDGGINAGAGDGGINAGKGPPPT